MVYQRGSASIYRADAIGSATCSRTQYAVKVVSEESREEALAVERLRREWTASRAATQRNLISILSGHVHCAPYYLVMPWIEGVNVGRHLAKHGRLATPVALWIARQTAEALGTLHAAGYLHGDIRPSKLIIDRSGHVTLVGLGSAKALPNEPTLADDAISG
ncbi:MAG TPA: protein kinase, partial [Pirellulales bacterium]